MLKDSSLRPSAQLTLPFHGGPIQQQTADGDSNDLHRAQSHVSSVSGDTRSQTWTLDVLVY